MRIFSKRTYEGFVCIDHKESPGFDETVAKAGHRLSILPFVGKGQTLKAATNKCSHCDKQVIRNPLRTRSRGHCPQCDRFLCDPCAVIYHLNSECRCFAKRASAYFDKLAKGGLVP